MAVVQEKNTSSEAKRLEWLTDTVCLRKTAAASATHLMYEFQTNFKYCIRFFFVNFPAACVCVPAVIIELLLVSTVQFSDLVVIINEGMKTYC